MKKLTKKQAKELSLLKWEFFIKNDKPRSKKMDLFNALEAAYPFMKTIYCDCGFCQYAKERVSDLNYLCNNCPASKLNCRNEDGLFQKWNHQHNYKKRILLANQILKIIKSVKA